MKNLVVAKFRDGDIIKGYTRDFNPKQREFHIHSADNPQERDTIIMQKLKAVFFVKDTTGNKDYVSDVSGTHQTRYGKLLEVEFYDGDIIKGYAQNYQARDAAFFMFPADSNSNNERIFIFRRAVRSIRSL